MANNDNKNLTNKNTEKEHYSAQDIVVLEGLDPVRKRPGMYIGGTGVEGLHHLIWEIVDNSVDEAMAGYATNVLAILRADGGVSVQDNGRGIPTDMHPTTKKSTLETVLTVLHAGGKFGGGGYKVSGGLHGVGLSVVNALSSRLIAEVERDGKKFHQEYSRGIPAGPVQEVGASTRNGTTITFYPDAEIFSVTELNWQTILNHCRQQAYLTKNLTITIKDQRDGVDISHTFYFEGGIRAFVRHVVQNRAPIFENPVYIEKQFDNTSVEVAMTYTTDFNEHVYAFANNIHTIEGGSHLTGFRSALTRAINEYAKKNNFLKGTDQLSGDDVREGLATVISVKLTDPQFEGQTKGKLGNPEIRPMVESAVTEGLTEFLNEHPSESRKIIEKVTLAARARAAARAARDTIIRKGALEGMTLPGKLADCSERNAAKSELFIVEGDSAGGCFVGDTKVALIDGRNLSFKEIVAEQANGKEHFCYTIRKNNKIGVEKIVNARMTKKQAEIVEVTLDNGESIKCTPDHKFMLRDGSYEEAINLKIDNSIMPLYRKLSDINEPGITINGYEMTWDPASSSWLFTHKLADWYNCWQKTYEKEDGDHCHHLDFNKLNNNPTNLARLPKDEHLALHQQQAGKTLHTPATKAKAKIAHQTKEFKEAMSQRMKEPATRAILSAQAKKQWENEEYKTFIANKWREFYESNIDYREANQKRLADEQKKYWSDPSNKQKQAERVHAQFVEHPDLREKLSVQAKAQWQNASLLDWRKNQTHEQWTAEFRVKRSLALNQTYFRKTIQALRSTVDKNKHVNLNAYQDYRMQTHDKSLLKFETFCNRYFNNDLAKTEEAVANYNHRVVSVKRLQEKEDVYDLEVPGTHNFALASGIFVHNSAKQGRDRTFQAILPLRGKILNVERARLDRMLTSEEIKNLIIALGAGVGDDIDLTKMRYHRIIIMTDADVDGAHIRTLLMTLFYRHFPGIITSGYLYIAQPPLYAIRKGKELVYAYSDAERDEVVKGFGGQQIAIVTPDSDKDGEPEADETVEPDTQTEEAAAMPKVRKTTISIQRYKGLGEMNAVDLWETTLNPEHRILLQVTVDDAERADAVFSMLMGDEVPPRKRFIQSRAAAVKNLDI